MMLIFKKMIRTLISAFLVFTSVAAHAQENSDIYQIKLQEPVKCIQHIHYEKTGEEIKSYLDDDKKTIYLENYKVNNKLKVKVIYEDGREEEILRSPCSVELSSRKII